MEHAVLLELSTDLGAGTLIHTQALMESLDLTVRWIDSWCYHTHKGGIGGTNVPRTFTGNAHGT